MRKRAFGPGERIHAEHRNDGAPAENYPRRNARDARSWPVGLLFGLQVRPLGQDQCRSMAGRFLSVRPGSAVRLSGLWHQRRRSPAGLRVGQETYQGFSRPGRRSGAARLSACVGGVKAERTRQIGRFGRVSSSTPPHLLKPGGDVRVVCQSRAQTAPAFWAYSQDAFASGTVRLADSIALALAAVPSRMRPAIPWVIPASRNRLYAKYQLRSGTALPVTLQ